MNWFHFILAFFGMYTTNDFSIEYIWKKRSVCIFETKCWFGWFFVHIPQKQSKDMVWNTFNFHFPQRIKLNQFRMQITKDYSEINLAFIKLWRLFFQIFLLNLQYILTCFLYNTWFFFLHLPKVKLASQSATSLSPEDLAVSILFHLSLEPVV